MIFSIPYNGDLQLLKRIKESGKFPVKVVYGKMADDIIGGGRPRSYLAGAGTAYGLDNLKEAVSLTHALGAEFNYLYNAVCLANLEFEQEKEIIESTGKLLDNTGIDRITVANPFLLKLLKKNFPDLKVGISKIAKVDTLEKASMYEELGADEITLYYSIQRNFTELEKIRKNTSLALQLIVNDGCIIDCPWSIFHQQVCCHHSQSGYRDDLPYIDFYRFNCTERLARDSTRFLKECWIRPEDLHYYEEIGYDRFKFIDRLSQTEWLMNMLEAYTKRHYDGNLADIIGFYDVYPEQYTPRIDPDKIDFEKGFELKKYLDLKPYIDNNELTRLDFFKFFAEKRPDCLNLDCSQCGYCENIAQKSVKIDRQNAATVSFNVQVIKKKLFELVTGNK